MEVQKQASGEQVQVSDENQNQETVNYATYKKLLTEKKNLQAKHVEMLSRLDALEEAKMQAEGDKDALIKSLQEKNRNLSDDLKSTKQSFAWNTLEQQIKRQAVEAGCKSPDKFMRLIDEDVVKGLALEVDDNYNINSETLKSVIEEQKQLHSDIGLFDNKKVNHTNFTGQKVINETRPIEKWSVEEIDEAIKNL
jgi:hypothetical protein